MASRERYNGKSSAQTKITALRFVHGYRIGEVHFAVKQTLRRFYQHHGQVYGRMYKNNEVKVPYQLVPCVPYTKCGPANLNIDLKYENLDFATKILSNVKRISTIN